MIAGRALHYVFKVAKRAETMDFYRKILGMKILRHEEFTQGCDAQCNGPYDNRWSKTMVGYGPESSHFVVELTYNYGVTSYEMGNDFGGITIRSSAVIERAKAANYPSTMENGKHILVSPGGYRFLIVNETQPTDRDPVMQVTLNVTDIPKSVYYWNSTLQMKIVVQTDNSAVLTYGENQARLQLNKTSEPLNRAQAYGRIAFAVPGDVQPAIQETIKKNNWPILTDLIKLDTPGKASVRVIILADPDGHEICFVDEEGFSELSKVDPEGEALLDKNIAKDPFEQQKA
ncbi:glyoxalase domain-containing protein 4 [Culicoides brevitarsis]|uniref:glyoxalase domain-containing protein 4 n=1 Tax=Culicoides brevitarsis TaxID=469753 RepID=UPI00307C0213